MIRAARLFDLLVLVLVGGVSVASLFGSPLDAQSMLTEVFVTLAFALLLSPLGLALLVLGQSRPRLERIVMVLNKLLAFVLACLFVGTILSLEKAPFALGLMPLIVFLAVAVALNITALQKQRRGRADTGKSRVVGPTHGEADHGRQV